MTAPLGQVVSRQSIPQQAQGSPGSLGRKLTGLAPLLVATALAATLGAGLPRWAWMWSIAVAIYAGCKWLTWWRAADVRRSAPLWRSLLYLLAWPGMDARAFLSSEVPPATLARREWISASIKTTLGGMLIWGICPLCPTIKHSRSGGPACSV